MAVERPTFHEAWYRVSGLRPRLLSRVKVYRQHFRGQMWHVLEDPSSNRFSRLSDDAWQFIALLDGKRTVSQAWQICNEQLGDAAPTQGEAIKLLGQLYCSNLLQAEVTPDAESLFNRYSARVKREVQSHLTNLLFVRIPLFDPDRFLERWVGLFGWVFSWAGLAGWVVLLTAGGYFVISNFGRFLDKTHDILAPGNLALLFVSFWVIKIVHEFSHSFACRKFGKLNGGGGQVHTLGIMLLVFAPLPYMDASSAWAFRNKWHRAIVGGAGMMAELAVASVAAIVWASTSAGAVNSVAHNIIFIASISTLVFNCNPLLRFDGYYILSDIIEIPNLSQRSKDYVCYLVKRYCWGVRRLLNPGNSAGERIWFVFYGLASAGYRALILINILLFLNKRLPEELFFVVPVIAAASIAAWLLVPSGKFVRYVATSPQLARTRMRAVVSTAGVAALLIAGVGVVKVGDRIRVEGVVEPEEVAIMYAAGDGFVKNYLPSGAEVSAEGAALIEAFNPDLEADKKGLAAQRRGLELQRNMAQARQVAEAQAIDEQLKALDEKIARVDKEIAMLRLAAPYRGTWVSPEVEHLKGAYVRRGEKVGTVASLDDVFVRATAGQDVAALLIDNPYRQVEMRAKGRPDVELGGLIEEILPAGSERLPSAALGYTAGGSMPTVSKDGKETRTAERFFEIRIKPDSEARVRLLSGQRVVVRCRMEAKPLAARWYRQLRQLFQRRFHI